MAACFAVALRHGGPALISRFAQTLQDPLIKEYTLNHNRDPYYNLRYIP